MVVRRERRNGGRGVGRKEERREVNEPGDEETVEGWRYDGGGSDGETNERGKEEILEGRAKSK